MVFINVGDPIGNGFVASVAQPGGNLTGFAVLETAIAGKWVDLLNEVAPQVSRVGFILHRETPANVGLLRAAEAGAPAGGKVIALGVHNSGEIERAVTEFAAESNGGLIAAPHAITGANHFGNWPVGISTSNRRVFRLSAGNLPQSSLGLFRQHRPLASFRGDAIIQSLSEPSGH
jgi:putative ABC transport system substrate-binding protein